MNTTKQANSKLRDALVQVKEIARTIYSTSDKGSSHEDLAEKLVEIAHAALAEPQRNCDRFASETEAQIAFLNEVWLISVNNLDLDPFDGWTNQMKSAYSKWLFAPATEKGGGAK